MVWDQFLRQGAAGLGLLLWGQGAAGFGLLLWGQGATSLGLVPT